MNSLTLRINKSNNKNPRNHAKFDVMLLSHSEKYQDSLFLEIFRKFNCCNSIEQQMNIVKGVISDCNVIDDYKQDSAMFLVDVFLQATVKHPLKLLLARYVTKDHPCFDKVLVSEISQIIQADGEVYSDYAIAVNKIASCLEHFPHSLVTLDLEVATYLRDCLLSCKDTLRTSKSLSPTEKNDIFNLTHLALRMLLSIIQKLDSEKIGNLSSVLKDVKCIIEYFMVDDDVPMDTKSVCGLVYLTTYMLVNGKESWIDILAPTSTTLGEFLHNDAVQLSLYFAFLTILPVDVLMTQSRDKGKNETIILVLTQRILAVGERSSSESVFVLSVTRSIHQVSKLLTHAQCPNLGLSLIEHLLLYIWGHLEHHMDSVRHLTLQALENISKCCTKLKKSGHPTAMNKLLSSLSSLDRSRKVYFVIIKLLTVELGTLQLMEHVPSLVTQVLEATANQAVQTSATSALETLIQKHAQENHNNIDFDMFLSPILARISRDNLTSIELDVLEGLIVTAFKADPNFDKLKPHLSPQNSGYNIKCALVLLSVIRKSSVGGEWRAHVTDDVTRVAATSADDETRILSLSFIVTSPKSTEVFEQADLDFILYFLKYNINAQSPNFRQLVLSLLKKFIKRFEDSYKVITRKNYPNYTENKDQYYLSFLDDLWSLCFDSLIPGANYSRRVVALQLLVWIVNMDIASYTSKWKKDHVEKLLLHLEDSYENNKANALDILQHCPVELLKSQSYSTPLDLESIITEANSTKPTDCVSAAYKLALLIRKLPGNITTEENLPSHEIIYTLLQTLTDRLTQSVCVCERSVVEASHQYPMYGLIRCIRRCLVELDVSAISHNPLWRDTIVSLVNLCVRVTSSVSVVVNDSSPEGHLPMDMGGIAVDDAGNSGGLTLKDGRLVTAQMVLLCAWRSVKEASLLLGEISSHFTIVGEHGDSGDVGEGTLTAELLSVIDDHFTTLLMETKHRGAFEQAYVGYTMFLTRMWRCRNPSLTNSLKSRLDELLEAIQGGNEALSATRRSAGIPFMIQALLSTELLVSGSGRSLTRVMNTLLQLCRDSVCVHTRTHCSNILRALYRCSGLQEAVSSCAGAGLLAAMEGFHSCSWMERNASTLLFSSLLTRIFGVTRARRDVTTRNKMTARIFFMRYPQLYDYMLGKLSSVCSDTELRPALYPILLLLGRLYPSSLDGTVSNLKLSTFHSSLSLTSSSVVLYTRRLAARALLPLIHTHMYFQHIESMLQLLSDRNIKKNFCHGILLQLTTLMQETPDGLSLEVNVCDRLNTLLVNTEWMLYQAESEVPCYMIADEYMTMIQSIVWRFPTITSQKMLLDLLNCLQNILFPNSTLQSEGANSGKDICLSNAVYLQIVIMKKLIYDDVKIANFLCKALNHDSYEVTLSAMNYLLLIYDEIDQETCYYLQHLATDIKQKDLESKHGFLKLIKTKLLVNIFKNTKYLECKTKSLQLLTLQKDNQKHIIAIELNNLNEEFDNNFVQPLINCIENAHENLKHLYLKNLLDLANPKTTTELNPQTSIKLYKDIINVMLSCSSSENSDNTREVVVQFLEEQYSSLHDLCLRSTEQDNDKFDMTATLLATIVTLLEDDDRTIRDRTATITHKIVQKFNKKYLNNNFNILSSKSGEELRNIIVKEYKMENAIALLVMLALLDFNSEVRLSDEVNDECRVFDQSERYNINLEETIWTVACSDLIQTHKPPNYNGIQVIEQITQNEPYCNVIRGLCKDNFTLFQDMMSGRTVVNNVSVNPKILLFVQRIKQM